MANTRRSLYVALMLYIYRRCGKGHEVTERKTFSKHSQGVVLSCDLFKKSKLLLEMICVYGLFWSLGIFVMNKSFNLGVVLLFRHKITVLIEGKGW